jgi:hypothetical protein
MFVLFNERIFARGVLRVVGEFRENDRPGLNGDASRGLYILFRLENGPVMVDGDVKRFNL